uniref:Protein FAM47A-like n=1 Tax=Jaculus jaculus TaxID=51337 RepID=A0A8C5KLB2_JACJA
MGEDWLPWNRPWQVLKPMPLGMNSKPRFRFQSRLPSRCFAKQKQEQIKFPTFLDGRRWVFVKEGLDDFRRGFPPPCKGLITCAKKSFLPTISHKTSRLDYKKGLTTWPKNANPFSTSLAQQDRKVFVENTEAHLTPHPLALWPLEKDIPEPLFLEVLEELDPDQKMEDKWAYCESRAYYEGHQELIEPQRPTQEEEPTPPAKFPGARKYGVLPSNKPKKREIKRSIHTVYYKLVPKGVSHFCEWVETFGDMGIDEDFIVKQFDLGYQCTPTYEDTAIKKIGLIPSEFTYCRRLSRVKQIRFSLQESNFEKKILQANVYEPIKEKFRYGAWYLKPKLWKKLVDGEPLIDPKVLLEYELERLGKPDIIDDLYGIIAFKDFIVSKGYSMPSILEKLFMRKRWDFDKVSTPIPRVLKAHELIMQKKDEDYDDEND